MVVIVPNEDWKVLKKYLGKGEGLVFVSEETLAMFPEDQQKKLREMDKDPRVEYDFGGEPDIYVDIIHDPDSYAAKELLGLNDEEDNE